MKLFFRVVSVFGGLCLCLAMVTLQANAVDISSSAISVDLAVGSIEIWEEEGITYCRQDDGLCYATTEGVIVRQTDSATTITENTIYASGGNCKVSLVGVNISRNSTWESGYTRYYYNSPIGVADATLELNLIGNNILHETSYYSPDIRMHEGSTLIINGTGSLTAAGNSVSFGSNRGEDYAGTLIINGGTIVANDKLALENLIINDTNSFSFYYAGIEDSFIINGGTVSASDNYSALSATNATINGGTITATGYIKSSKCMIINGGTINSSIQSDETITIMGGVIKTNNSNYPGICIGSAGTLTINGGIIKGRAYPDIGGYGSVGGCVIINGGTFTTSIRIGERDCPMKAVTISNAATVEARSVEEIIYIDNQPALPLVSHPGNTPAASVTAHNHSDISYQWQISSDNKNWTDLEGDVSSKLKSFAMSEDLDGAYLRCKLTNGWGNTQYTDAINIYVLAFAQQPVSVEAQLNDMVAFEALSACDYVDYRWQRSYDEGESWVDVPGETFSTLIVNVTLAESSAKYRCVITATNGDELASEMVSVDVDMGDLVTYTVCNLLQKADGSGYTVADKQVLESFSGATVTAPDASYEGFSENLGKGTISGKVAEDSSLVLTRYFDRNTYSVTFDTMGGGAYPALKALYGAAIDEPSTPSRYGYDFAGWYADKELTEEYTFSTMPLGGTTVYAKWVPVGVDRGIEYTINGLGIRNSSTFELQDDIPEGNFLVEVSVTNLEATKTDAILLVYYSEQGQMIGMNYMFTNIPVGYTATFGALVNNEDGRIGRVAAFVLPSLGNPIPLAESKSIS